jgi:plasmid replication initiation protein
MKNKILFNEYEKILKEINGKEIITQESTFFTKIEKRVLCFMLSNLKSTDTEFPTVTINIPDFARIMRINQTEFFYELIRDAVIELSVSAFEIEVKPGIFIILHWFQSGVKIDEEKNEITLRFNDLLKPLLLGEGKVFTAQELQVFQ